ncbi:fork head domain-containing protein FD4-like [Agrilus planipennis]|uniref:Fork head domain-containing protein FD4-like n=1 Tax=Agrilus planipennis TaxID=224129 RepID=A0A1W4WM20_AGRPL|nr:fork head domain-containing protein FD4-like [Agrilus planipennis]
MACLEESPKISCQCCDATLKSGEFNNSLFFDKGQQQLRKPPFTFVQLITQALITSPNHQLPLSEIYKFIADRYPYYRIANDKWKNNIRYTLSFKKECFIKVPRMPGGHGAYWRMHDYAERALVDHAFSTKYTRF